MAETIVARGTPSGRSAIAVVRISGNDCAGLLAKICRSKNIPTENPRKMICGEIFDEDGSTIDDVLVVYFPEPHSYTGQDMAEIQCHGGQTVSLAIVERLIKTGARPALPGEFTRRAFENGKIDLSKAEAIIRLIDAETKEQVKGASRAMKGELGDLTSEIREKLIFVLSRIEASIDFPDEPETAEIVLGNLASIIDQIEDLDARVHRTGDQGSQVVFYGKPNVGKSSLINAIAGRSVSIVTDEPGTTRDAVSAQVTLGGLSVCLVDTAGHQEDLALSQVDKEAARVAKEKVENAAMLIWVTQMTAPEPPPDFSDLTPLVVVNKSDLAVANVDSEKSVQIENEEGRLVSAKTGAGVAKLIELIQNRLTEKFGPADGLPISTRQKHSLDTIYRSVKLADQRICNKQLELAAEDIQMAIAGTNELLGVDLEVDVLDKIFSEFCIGK
ncbi:MAG: tRNA uridine-5-carboxymethylaminomethyl(34) synthesis GTPase MnmE [Deltaproteobacteria bacterium]|nr:tRNA uridine-5-carboxymethylaminomethyl(34) synthesis GTPase MnmE [Deltaproteobacteria bacterium]